MKFLVDELPYYGGFCPFLDANMCRKGSADSWNCPRKWDKYYVCSSENPHECEMLKESAE